MGKVDKVVEGVKKVDESLEKLKDGKERIQGELENAFCEDIPEEELQSENNNSKRKKKHKTKRLVMWKVKLIAGLVVVALVAIMILKWKASGWLSNFLDSMQGEHITVTESTLTKVLDISELSTVSCDYSSVLNIPTKTWIGTTTDHFVAYKAEIQIGIDFSKVNVTVNEEKKEIQVKLPSAKVLNVSVEANSLDFLDDDDKSDTEFALEAYKKCCEDANTKIKSEKPLFEVAKQNAEGAVKGLFEPIIDASKEEYTLIFK